MGAFDALRNLAIFLFIINLFAVLAGAVFLDFGASMIYGKTEQLTENMEEQVNALSIDSTSTIGNVVSAWGLAKTFFKNMLTGNYYVWRALGLDQGFSITSTGVTVHDGGFTLAVVLGIIGEMVYVLGMIEFIRGRV
jgi:hypothetical protein